ncbi:MULTISPECIES: Ig-like domain-containing protein [unclassified Streptomyces]|uniref:Ig-like domain-containing protein n=1 Tax=unclassified Streptomyces TaxID=2593676 RepID=UPI00037455A0|nr:MULTISPECIES: Ig-like domain-containing protein [unclassified Streptomyces]MYY03055.1 hypothetical protein [Streptomyces sp. SID4913]
MAKTQQLAAELTLTSGAKQTVTSTATWTSATPAVATVSAGGLVTAVAVGTAVIKAAAQGKEGTCTVTVTDPATLMTVTPGTADLDLTEA